MDEDELLRCGGQFRGGGSPRDRRPDVLAGLGEVPATELVLHRLLPVAHEGLERWGVSQAVRDRYLSVIEQRCLTSMNGACWQAECVARQSGLTGTRRCARCWRSTWRA